MTMTTVETDRLILRPFTAQDIDFLDILHSDPLVMRYILGRTRSHEENIAYLNRLIEWQADHGIGQRLVIRKEDNQPVGRCGMSFFYGAQVDGILSYQLDPKAFEGDGEVTRVIELGYTFQRSEWGKGYASEAAAAMRGYGLNVQKFPELHSVIVKKNKGSVAVAEKIGAKRLTECLCLGSPAWDYLSRL
ncbi:MAG TPA: N-acetyltransferase [Sphingomonadales bacterium]|nr:N-acetyltransferase [Sphingomonadales bacterium]